jgi:hypothetical protein
MSSGLAGIDCRRVAASDYPSKFELRPVEVMKTIAWLIGLG